MEKMILLTGGTGMLGAHVLLDLVKQGKKVRALKRSSSNLSQVKQVFEAYSANAEELFRQIEWVDGDVTNLLSLKPYFAGVDTVIHTAAMVSFHSDDRETMLFNNIEGTANMVNLALEFNVRKFCHVSSIAAVGRAENGESITEKHQWIPDKKHSSYSESKFFSEMEVWRGIEEGLDAVIVNPSVILGVGNWKMGSPQYFSIVNDGLKFFTKGGTGYVDARDVSNVILLTLDEANWEKTKNQRYIVSAENVRHQDVFNYIAEELNVQKPSIYANSIMLSLAWRAAKLVELITRKKAAITRETVSGADQFNQYCGKKITEVVAFQYRTVEESVRQIASIFKQQSSV
ncbi:NAD-dependent epimerase/dehydratase family protein [Prolixibacteraceae bacterium JC049]|nr:NAD-dependent epimerase/dehydratase family protein [Prolixibacteraceae bacterium JC049]